MFSFTFKRKKAFVCGFNIYSDFPECNYHGTEELSSIVLFEFYQVGHDLSNNTDICICICNFQSDSTKIPNDRQVISLSSSEVEPYYTYWNV